MRDSVDAGGWCFIVCIAMVIAGCVYGAAFAQQRALPPLEDVRWRDPRFCGFPVPRDADGSIRRNWTVVKRFRETWPCPDPVGTSCPAWAVDHAIPLVCGGCDSIGNMQWLKLTIKACAGTECKDRWEQRVYCR